MELIQSPDDGMNEELESLGSVDSFVEHSLCQSCGRTFKSIWNVLKYPEFYLPLTFFLVQGILMPNFDDLHYMFLTERVGMSKSNYDFLNILTYVGLIFFVTLYKWLLTDV